MILVFDMGATRTRMTLVENGRLGEVVRMPTDAGAGGFDKLLAGFRQLARDHKLTGVIGGMPGQLEGEEGALVLAQNLPDWRGIPVKLRLEQEFGCPVQILNDVVIGGLGEACYGAGITKGVMAYFTVSTGVNAVRIVDSRPDASIARYEIGKQLILNADGELESLGALIGGAAMKKHYGKQPREIHDATKWHLLESRLAIGVYNTALHWTPEVVVFGGSMMRDIDLDRVRHDMELLPKVLPRVPRLEYARLDDTMGLYGALAWAHQFEVK